MPVSSSNARVRRAKFVPPQPSPWAVPRDRLLRRLDDARYFPVTLVSAAAGSGKTTLMAEWVRGLDLPWGWVTIDDADDTLDAVLTNVIVAMQAAAPGVGESVLSHLRLDPEPNLDALVAELDDDLLALEGDVVVVIDDAHLIADPASIDFLQRVLQHPPARLHLVLGARRDPPLPVAQLRARGQLVELRAADLAFSEGETRALLRNAGVSSELAVPLEQRNDGWAVGIHLGALALRRQGGGHTVARGVDEIVAAGVHDLIVSDILGMQSEPLQQLLLVSSLVQRFTPDLCMVLLDEPMMPVRSLLQVLAAEGLLIFSLGGDPEWFRYHQIFREVLLRELGQRTAPDDLARLHARASSWFEQYGLISEALDHALAAGSSADPVALVERHAQLAIADDRWPELAQWLDRLPDETVRSRPELVIAQAWVFQSRGAYAQLASAIDRATVLIDAEEDQRETGWSAALKDDLAVMGLFLQSVEVDPDAWVERGERSLATGRNRFASSFGVYGLGFGLLYRGRGEAALMRERMNAIVEDNRGLDDSFARQRELWAREMIAFGMLLEGELADAESRFDQIVGLASAFGMGRFVAQTRYLQGTICYERNQLDQAIDLFERVVHERSTGIINLVHGSIGLVRSLEAAGRSPEADVALRRLQDRMQQARQPSFGKELTAALEADLALGRGDLDTCRRWLHASGRPADGANAVSHESPMLTRARIHLALGQLDLADAELRALEQRLTQPPRDVTLLVRIAAARALHIELTGNRPGAMLLLEQVAELYLPLGYMRSLLDAGAGFPVFGELLAHLTQGVSPFIRQELDGFSAFSGARPASAPTVWPNRDVSHLTSPADQLTEREQEVMSHLLQRRAYKEIAEALDISPLTVKSHAIRVYAKLGVGNRRQMILLLERAGQTSA